MSAKILDSQKRIIAMVVVMLIVGVFYAFIAPAQFDFTQNTLMWKNTSEGSNWPGGPTSRFYMGALLRAAMIMGGLALIALAYPMYQGRKFAYPVALTLMAIAPVGHFYIGLGYMENFSLYPPIAFPPAWFAWIVGLVGFLVLILLKEMDNKAQKVSSFVTLLMIGMVGSQAFALMLHAYRVISRDMKAAISVPSSEVMVHSGGLHLLVLILSFLAIYKIAQRKESGWWYALVAGLAMAVASFPPHYERPPSASLVPTDTLEPSVFTSTYWMAGAQAVLLVILLLLPYFRNNLYDKTEEEA